VLAIAACGDDGAGIPKVDVGQCLAGTMVEINMVAPTLDPVVSDLTVYGSVLSPSNVLVLRVFVGAGAEDANVNDVSSTIAAAADTSQFQTWHAAIPHGVLLASLTTVPGLVKLVARPEINCRVDVQPSSVTITVDRSLDAGVDRVTSGVRM
jgi:hypothetical protein